MQELLLPLGSKTCSVAVLYIGQPANSSKQQILTITALQSAVLCAHSLPNHYFSHLLAKIKQSTK